MLMSGVKEKTILMQADSLASWVVDRAERTYRMAHLRGRGWGDDQNVGWAVATEAVRYRVGIAARGADAVEKAEELAVESFFCICYQF
jgi:hypothetical protein